MTIEEKLEKAKLIYFRLKQPMEEFEITRFEELNADYFFPITDKRGVGGTIIADDGTYFICGSRYPVSHYIEEFKNGIRHDIETNKFE